MGDNASLDDFLGGESSEQSEAADATADTGTAGGSDTEPAAATYAWSDDGVVCGNCGETVERCWQQDGGLVCTECKDWTKA